MEFLKQKLELLEGHETSVASVPLPKARRRVAAGPVRRDHRPATPRRGTAPPVDLYMAEFVLTIGSPP